MLKDRPFGDVELGSNIFYSRGAVTMFPKLAELWKQQVEAEQGWKHFGLADFRHLSSQFGVDWVVVASPISGLACPYHNEAVAVCQIK